MATTPDIIRLKDPDTNVAQYPVTMDSAVLTESGATVKEAIEVIREKVNDTQASLAQEVNEFGFNSIKTKTKDVTLYKNEGYAILANTKKIAAAAGYFYTEMIELSQGESVIVTSKDPSGNVVARVSLWDEAGTSCKCVLSKGTTETTTYTHTATFETEYIRLCGYGSEAFDVDFFTSAETQNNFDSIIKSISCDSIDLDFIEDSFINRSNGNILSASGYYATDFVKINGGSKVIVSTSVFPNDSTGVCFYDKDKKFITGIYQGSTEQNTLTTKTYIAPYNAAYLRFSFYEEGLSHTSSKMYVLNSADSIGINYYDGEIHPVYTYGYYILSSLKYYTTKAKALTANKDYFISELIPIVKGATISVVSKDDSGSVISRISIWDANDTTFIKSVDVGTTTETTGTYTATKDVEYVRICGYTPNSMTINVKGYILTSALVDTTVAICNSITDKPLCDISMFDDIAVCGDSYTAGAIFNGTTFVGEFTNTSWGKILGRMCGASVSVCASSGANTDTWQTRTTCLPKLLGEDAHGLVVLALGINDADGITLGTIDDIKDDYTENPNTFYGNYGKIIQQVINHSSSTRVILVKSLIPIHDNGRYYDYMDTAIEEIAAKFNIPYAETKNSKCLVSSLYDKDIRDNGSHPTAPTYSLLANAMREILSKTIDENLSYFSLFRKN